MARHNELGLNGEDAACNYLIKQGYQIRHRNWRSSHKELDIVAFDHEELVVIEVKTRRNIDFGLPEEAITQSKIKRIIASTDAYVKRYSLNNRIRFDIISVVGEKEPFSINHIKDAFYPPIW